MKLVSFFRGFVLSSLVLFSGVSSATLIEFGSSANNPFSFNFRNFENVIGDIDLTITAGVFSDRRSSITLADSGDERRLGIENNDGLGVLGFFGADTNSEIDGRDNNDIVIFTFSEAVLFTGIEFGNVDRQDDFHFGLVDGDTFVRTLVDTRISSDSFTFDSPLFGTVFAVGAVESNDSFTINGINVVPEPSSLFLLAILLIGFSVRKKFVK